MHFKVFLSLANVGYGGQLAVLMPAADAYTDVGCKAFGQHEKRTFDNSVMSRSTRKTPKTGITTAETEKENKRTANRKFRRVTKAKVKKGDDELPLTKELSNVWSFDKDGKQFLKKPTKEDLRK